MVKINRVTTRAGDDGRTALGDGARLPKFHIRIAANGSIDEANSFIGLARLDVIEETAALLSRIQNDLFDIGADLCRPERSGLKVEPLRFSEKQVDWIEAMIQAKNANLPALSSFVMPGGVRGAATLHVARSIVRRAEREIVEVAFQEPITPAIIRYMNRLSDLLFILARSENLRHGTDVLWEPAAHQA
ncbi:cob(I)yrinic acid a,c-diamide adenosyltransferase [Methylobacterium oxalidis]|uniref:cob(I)yrinic acid a,c-diamide adenosyltransferase n=1 Tax=Methylobacterium oxalidis TaxID=944322 RepID=UPI003315DF8C